MDSMPNLGLGRDSYVFAVYHPCWLITTPGGLMSGNINVGVIFSGSKGRCLNDPQIDRDFPNLASKIGATVIYFEI